MMMTKLANEIRGLYSAHGISMIKKLLEEIEGKNNHNLWEECGRYYKRQYDANKQLLRRTQLNLDSLKKEISTEMYLERWASDKPHFNKVRLLMGNLLKPDPVTGVAAVPLMTDGKVDLDKAYDLACRAKGLNPT